MFRSPRYLEKVDYKRFDLNTPLNVPGKNQHQVKTGLKFEVKDQDVIYDWYNAYFRVEYQLQALANGALVAANTQSAPININLFSRQPLNFRTIIQRRSETLRVSHLFCSHLTCFHNILL